MLSRQISQTVGRSSLLGKNPELDTSFLLKGHHLKTRDRAWGGRRNGYLAGVLLRVGKELAQRLPRSILMHPDTTRIGVEHDHMFKIVRTDRDASHGLKRRDSAGRQADGVSIRLGLGDGHICLGPRSRRLVLYSKWLLQIFFGIQAQGTPCLIRASTDVPTDEKLNRTRGIGNCCGLGGPSPKQQCHNNQQRYLSHKFLLDEQHGYGQ